MIKKTSARTGGIPAAPHRCPSYQKAEGVSSIVKGGPPENHPVNPLASLKQFGLFALMI
ncbi:MAG: hypothetical protein JW885_11625 [Deltaproteobacteria bacterium]|nr:hypothetical protein [Candidatus Zymogenaceae bacterium]